MSKIFACTICNSEFKNSRSLYAHKYKYHPKASTSTADSEEIQNMKYEINDNASSTQNEPYFKTVSQLEDFSQNKIKVNKNKSLRPYIKRLPKLFKITGVVLNDIKYLKKAVSMRQKQNISSVNRIISKMKYIERLPKLFKITGDILNDVKDLEEDVSEIQSENNASHSEMSGSGKENKNKINELSDDIDRLFIKIAELEGTIEKYPTDTEYIEKVIDNTLQIIELFKNNMYSDIKYKIKELRNAALFALKTLKRAKALGNDDEKLLHSLVNASIFDGKELLEKNVKSLDTIFSNLPSEEEFMQVVKELKSSINNDNDVHFSKDFVINTDEESGQSGNEEDEEHDAQSADERESLRDQESNVSEDEEIVEMEEEPVIYKDVDKNNDEKESLTDQKSDMSEDEEAIDMDDEVTTEAEEELVNTESSDKELVDVSGS